MCRSTGTLLVRDDAPARADVIYVLDGSFIERAVEAADLFRAGFAPRILISPGTGDPSAAIFEAEGVHLPTKAEFLRDMFVHQLGLPATAIQTLSTPVGSTADEANLIAPLVARERWSRVIVITDRASTRRAGFIFRKVLGPNVSVIATSSRRDAYDPGRWWTSRPMVRTTFYELPKVLIYWMGLSG